MGRDNRVLRARSVRLVYVVIDEVLISGMRRDINADEGSNRRFRTCSIVESGREYSDDAAGSDIVLKIFAYQRLL